MKKEQLTTRIRRYREIAQKTDDPSVHNTCMNRLSVLEIMLDRYERSQVMDTGEWYDDETDFRTAYRNTVDEMLEAD